MSEAEAWPDLPSLGEYRYAVAIHEAGHAVVFACYGIEVLRMQLSKPGSTLTGETHSGEIIAANRTDLVASLMAGDIAVDLICDPRMSAGVRSARDQQLLRHYEQELHFTDHERSVAHSAASRAIDAHRRHVISIADALIAKMDGRLEVAALEPLLAPVRDECERSRR